MSPPKRPMPPRPSAVGRPPSFAPGPRAPARPMVPLAPLAPLSSSFAAPYTDPDLLDGPTVTGFDPPEESGPTDTEELQAATYDDPTHLTVEDYPPPPPRSVPPPRPSHSRPPPKPSYSPPPRSAPPPRPSTPAPRQASPARPSIPPPRPSVPAPRQSFSPPPRPSVPAAARSMPPAANPFLAPSVPPPPAAPMFDDVNTAFVGGANMAPDFDALEARASRPEWNKHMDSPQPMRARAHSIDLGEGVVVETLAGFEPNRSNKAELSEAWRPEGLPRSDVLEKPNVMRLESIRPPEEVARHAAPPAHLGYAPNLPGAPRISNPPPTGRPPAPSIDLHAEVARANQGRVRVAYVVAGISILLLIVAILSAVLSIY